jgi:DNA-binding MarR family transcriptional regulator
MPGYASAVTFAPPRPAVDARELDGFITAWERFGRASRRAQGRASQAASSKLSHAQYLLVESLLDEPAMAVSQLADAAGVAQPTATRTLAALERDGVLRRRRSDGDRRVVLMELTPDGRSLVAGKRVEIIALRGRIFASIPERQRAQAAELLHRLAAAVDEL